LWALHRAGDPAARDRLYRQHLGLVRHIAIAVARSRPQATLDDLIGAGALGLGQALDRFRPDRGLRFSTLAGTRIRGAMLDWIRSQSPQPRHLHGRRVRLEAATQVLAQRRGARPPAAAVAAALQLTLPAYWQLRDQVAVRPVPLESERFPIDRQVVVDRRPVPIDELIRTETRLRVRGAVTRLPARLRNVVLLYHFEGQSIGAIGRRLDVTASRVCQLLKGARLLLRRALASEEAWVEEGQG
jgi:RNA polymerase sigma factor for flagellar operon FliA